MPDRTDPTAGARMKRRRERLRDKGLVEVRVWVRPENADAVKRLDESKGLTRSPKAV